MESQKTIELCSKLYKTGKEQQVFLGFQILKQEQKEIANKAKSFWIFYEYQTETRRYSKPILEIKEANKEKQQKCFWSFVFWKVKTKQEQQRKGKKSETWIYKVPTEYDV
jgi:hypothetical protein